MHRLGAISPWSGVISPWSGAIFSRSGAISPWSGAIFSRSGAISAWSGVIFGSALECVDEFFREVIPAKAGTHPSLRGCRQSLKIGWVPAFAGMTFMRSKRVINTSKCSTSFFSGWERGGSGQILSGLSLTSLSPARARCGRLPMPETVLRAALRTARCRHNSATPPR